MDAGDERLEFIRTFTLKSFKLKPDKWQEFIVEKSNRIILCNFFEKSDFSSVFLSRNAETQLVVSRDFPPNIRTKAIHFTKRENKMITKDNIKTLLTEEVANAALGAPMAVTEEVVYCLLTNKLNSSHWPAVVAEDVCRQMQRLKNETLEVRGRVQGRTFLPLPGNADSLADAGSRLPCQIDRKCLHVLDTVIIDWTQQVTEILNLDSAQPILDGLHPLPQEEFDFWNKRLINLDCIYRQLMSPKARKMASIVEKAESVYWPALSNIYKDVEEGLKEAADVVLHLTPLQKILEDVDQMEYSQLATSVVAVMHTLRLVCSRCQYYRRPCRIIVILQEICNLFIHVTRNFLCPEEVMKGLTGDIDLMLANIRLSMKTLVTLRETYNQCKTHMGSSFKDGNTKTWDFPSHLVFTRMDAFLKRLHTIEDVYSVSVELYKLEKVEVQGFGGRAMTSMVCGVYEDFLQHINLLAECKYDAIDTEDKSFEGKLKWFQVDIADIERRLGSILCKAFDDCASPESTVKLLETFGFILDWPLIQKQLCHRYRRLVEMVSTELDAAKRMLHAQKEAGGKNMPPIAGRLQWAQELRQRIQMTMKSFKALKHPCLDSDEAKLVLHKHDEMVGLLRQYCDSVLSDWSCRVHGDCRFNLEQPLLLRHDKNLLSVNFSPQLVALLREVNYLTIQGHNIPPTAAELFSRKETFRKYVCNLELMVSWYNQVQTSVLPVEFPLIQEELKDVEVTLAEAESILTWNTEGVEGWIKQARDRLDSFHSRFREAKTNMDTMQSIMKGWSVTPMFQRSGGQKDSLLDLDRRAAELDMKYRAIRESGEELHRLIQENRRLFEADESTEPWSRYIDHIDDQVMDGFFHLVHVSLHFLSDNMNPQSSRAPLLEVGLELEDGEMVFQPSLSSGLPDLMKTLITDVYTAASLMPRLSRTNKTSYQLSLDQVCELSALDEEMMRRVLEVREEAEQFREELDRYSYLWQDDRAEVLDQFLTYGHLLSPNDLERDEAPAKKPPTLEDFQKEVDSYEKLYREVSSLDDLTTVHRWLQIDLRPFKRSLMSTIQDWGHMLKQYLVDSITSSLQEVRVYQGLEDEDQAASDSRFPLRETIVMLEACGLELPDHVYTQLQWQ